MKKSIVFLFVCMFAMPMLAWDAVGHRIVTEVAYQNLTKKAQKGVDKVLGKRGMVYRSSWPDEIKSDTIYSQSHVWHYQNMKADLSRNDIIYLYNNKTAEGEHAFYALDSLVNVLKQNPNDEVALLFVVHIMGDVFQPMHLGHPDDKGGNKVQMRWFNNGTNLHAVWDRWLIDYTQYNYSEFVTYLIETYQDKKKEYQAITPIECVFLTYDLQQQVYAYQKKKDNSAYHYAYRFRPDLDRALYMAGVQLAKLLNEIYK